MRKINFKVRRSNILDLLNFNEGPIKGQDIASKLGVTRQIIVKDIAILRAEGNSIIATPEGYMIEKSTTNKINRIIAVNHSSENTRMELEAIIKYGGIVKDVIIEHRIYGEISANLMLKTYYDVEKFINKLNNKRVEPLSKLTGGLHLHTIEADSIEIMDKIIDELDRLGFLVKDIEK